MAAWSYSALSDFFNCPRSYQLKRVTKECKTTETDAIRHGIEMHKHLELRVANKTPLPPQLMWMERAIANLESSGEATAEQQLAITEGFKKTDWFAEDVWLRVIFDLAVRSPGRSIIADYKTGKRKFNNDQLMLFAGVEMAMNPEVEEVRTAFVWIKDAKIDTETYTRADIPSIWNHFLPRVEKLNNAFATDTWPERPSGLCSWCPARRNQCKHAKN